MSDGSVWKKRGFVPVGYLHGKYRRGKVPSGFLGKLKLVENSQFEVVISIGHHVCQYCFPGGDGQVSAKIRSGELKPEDIEDAMTSCDNVAGNYVWPGLLDHYVRGHNFLPPKKFIDFIMKFDPEKTQPVGTAEILFPPFE